MPDVANLLMSDHGTQAFTFAQETSKQIITLATGLIGVTVALLGQLKTVAHGQGLCLLHFAWLCAGASVLFGVGTLMTLTGHLGQTSEPEAGAIYSSNVRLMASVQVLAFLGALGSTIAFGISVS